MNLIIEMEKQLIGDVVYKEGINMIKDMKFIKDDIDMYKCEFLLYEGESIVYKMF